VTTDERFLLRIETVLDTKRAELTKWQLEFMLNVQGLLRGAHRNKTASPKQKGLAYGIIKKAGVEW